MPKTINIEATGTLHKIRDPEGASYRFVTDTAGELTSAVIFREGNIIDEEEVVRYQNVKFTVTIEIDEDDKECGIETISG